MIELISILWKDDKKHLFDSYFAFRNNTIS